MRDIKFRAWDKAGKMIAVGDLQFINNGIWVTSSRDKRGFSTTIQDGAGCTLMQFTGLKDKNGKEIYEGDLLTGETYYEADNDAREWTFSNPAVVKWMENEAGFYPFTLNIRWRCDVVNVEVIGNIYENPELIQEEDSE